MTITGYKAAHAFRPGQVDAVKVVVVLEIPDDALTNLDRAYVVNRDTAKFRCDTAKVMRIYDPNTGDEFRAAQSGVDGNYRINYVVGKTSCVADFDIRPDVLCTNGIHFFLTEEPARYYLYASDDELKQNKTLKQYYDCGSLMVEIYTTETERHFIKYKKDGSKERHIVYEYPLNGNKKQLVPEPKPEPKPTIITNAPTIAVELKPPPMRSQAEQCCTIC